ncbi:alpha/beta hydrolase-fold protein [Mucilaginibacter celer]|uniref:Tetratricopeptide repeat protein n=1 Tax=Mucilaginibacter celer TaxID=2305508 RepID=A0A494VT90_9SPHI|nr:alpha/beta hydrolase-fold protein [Mucilaginibacter celer]AYL94608.1 tetratricopeptide repeat protein [Mucilaginibacter celer]
MNHIRFYFLFVCLVLLLSASGSAFGQDALPARNDTAVYSLSPIMGEQRTLWIHVPADYYTSANTYPVLYLLDGDAHFGYASQMTDFLAGHDRNRIPEMIVVGIVNIDRQRDFSPVYAKKPNGSADSTRIVPDTGLGRFARYLKNEVVPYIDSHYRVQPYRILAAHSLAGLPAMYTKEIYPQLFSATVLTSPVLSGPLVRNLDAFLKADHPHNGKLFIGIGNENTSAVDALIKRIREQAPGWFEWSNAQYSGENHFTVPYTILFDGIKFIYRSWFLDYYGNESVTMQDINSRFARLSAEFGYAITPNEEYLNNCGYYQLRLKHIDNAIGIFEENVKQHLDSFNAYDSLGEAYMNAGNKTLAIKNYEKSIRLNPNNDGGKQMLKKLKKQ